MDPVTHTLVGAGLAEAGLKRRTPLGTATLLIGVNLPDIDVLSYAWGETHALAFRRGWTHGILAWVVLPVVLTGIMVAWDRWVRRRRRPGALPARAGPLFGLAGMAVLTHPTLDFLNVYGIRLLAPFSNRWYYGDTLFIVDPWCWAILATGLVATRRRGPRAARLAVGVLAGYIGLMGVSAAAARWMVWRALPFSRAGVDRVMVAPVPVTPFAKHVVLDEGDQLQVGQFNWLADPPVRYSDMVGLNRLAANVDALAAARDPRGRRFLAWARFPYFEPAVGGSTARITIIDARYALDAEAPFGAITIEVGAP